MLPIDELILTLECWVDQAQMIADAPKTGLDTRSYCQGKISGYRTVINHICKMAERDYRLGQYYENRREVV